jgi:PAS domain S-box-containing protein
VPELSEAEQTLEAIREGQVDAVVVEGSRGPQVYSLEGPDRPFRTFVESMHQGAITLDADDTILYSNAFFAETLGVRLESVIGARLTSFVSPKDQELYRSLQKDSVRAKASARVSLLSGEGEVAVRLSFNPLPGSDPPTCCVVVADLRDEERVRKEQVAREAAEAASLAKDQFLMLLSHELRAPLQSILGWAQILQRSGLSAPDFERGIDAIERNARAQAHLVSDLLDMSRITSGKLHFEKRPVDIHEVVESAIASIRPSAKGRTLRHETSIEPGATMVPGDPDRLQQIIWNLLSNAVKFTADDGEIRVATRVEASSVVIVVEDDGQGISPEFLPRLFDLFQQAETPTNRSGGGLGLGTAIVKQLTELHGGSVSSESDGIGQGSRFTVRLPVISGDSVTRASSRVKTPAQSMEGRCVLVVDDDADTRDVIARGLEAHGAKVFLASESEEAMRMVAIVHPDILVADIAMPRGNGYELIRELRLRGFGEGRLPAIAVSAFAGSDDEKRALDAGFQVHVSKPIEVDELSAIASELVRRKGQAPPES